MTKKEAIGIILSDREKYATSLNYAIGYCQEAMRMDEGSHELNVQVLYILNNITHWRHPLAKSVRETLRRKDV